MSVTLLSLAALALTLAPWTIRNYIVLGGFVPVATNGGIVLWINNNPEATGYYLWPKNDPLDLIRKPNGKLDEVKRDKVARQLAFTWIRANPRRFVELGRIRVQHTFETAWDTYWAMAVMPDGNPSPYLDRAATITTTFWRWARRLAYVGFGIQLLVLLWRRNRRTLEAILIPFGVVAAFVAITFVFEGQPRYNVPLLPLWFLAAVYPFCHVAESVSRRV